MSILNFIADVFPKVIQPVIMLISVMLIAGVFRETPTSKAVFTLVNKYAPSKRAMLAVTSAIFGVLPIPGRIMFTCSILDSLQNRKNNNTVFGTIAYLATHHYYLWSPLEKAIIVTCSILAISYYEFMSYMIIPALIAVAACFIYIFCCVKEDDIVINEKAIGSDADLKWSNFVDIILMFIAFALVICGIDKSGVYVFAGLAAFYCLRHRVVLYKNFSTMIDWKLIGIVSVVIVAGALLGKLDKTVLSGIEGFVGSSHNIVAIGGLCFLSAFLLGSSAKYAAIVGLVVKLVGMKYLPFIYLVDYFGYLISPAHKCLAIGNCYFRTPVKMFLKPIVVLGVVLTIYGLLVSFVL